MTTPYNCPQKSVTFTHVRPYLDMMYMYSFGVTVNKSVFVVMTKTCSFSPDGML